MQQGVFDDLYRKWQSRLIHTNASLILVGFICQLIGYIIVSLSHTVTIPLLDYIVYWLLLPLFCNLFFLVFGGVLLKMDSTTLSWSEFIPIIQMTGICMVFATRYAHFYQTVGVLVFSLFVGIVFDRVSILAVSMLFSLYSAYHIGMERIDFNKARGVADPYVDIEIVVAFGVIITAFFISRNLLRFQLEKSTIIQKAHDNEVLLQEALNRDAKTGLFSSTYFRNALEKTVDMEPEQLILMITDIDNFKVVNDTYGHANGDIVLLRLAELLRAYFGEENCPSRFGGEEFTALVLHCDKDDMIRRAESFREAFAKQNYPFCNHPITISIGLAVWEKGWTELKLFDYADAALYQAKTQGKNCVCCWSGFDTAVETSNQEVSHE